jgi:hypothetical protein
MVALLWILGIGLVLGLGGFVMNRGTTRRIDVLRRRDPAAAARAEHARAEAYARSSYGNGGVGF